MMVIVFKAVCVVILSFVALGFLAFGVATAWAGEWISGTALIVAGILVGLPSKYDPAIRIKEMLGGDR